MVRLKYRYGDEINPIINMNKAGSNLWRGICNAWEDFRKGMTWRIGNGRTINIWNDHWIPNVGGPHAVCDGAIGVIEGT